MLNPEPKKEIVGISRAAEMCPKPLSVARAYLHKEIMEIDSRRLYLPQMDIIEISLQSLIVVVCIVFVFVN